MKVNATDEQVEVVNEVLSNLPSLKNTMFYFKDITMHDNGWLSINEFGERTSRMIEIMAQTQCLQNIKFITVKDGTSIEEADNFDFILDLITRSEMLETVELVKKKMSSEQTQSIFTLLN